MLDTSLNQVSVIKKASCSPIGSVFLRREGPRHRQVLFKETQNTQASFISRVLIHSDGSESLSLIVYNHTAPQSNGSLI